MSYLYNFINSSLKLHNNEVFVYIIIQKSYNYFSRLQYIKLACFSSLTNVDKESKSLQDGIEIFLKVHKVFHEAKCD